MIELEARSFLGSVSKLRTLVLQLEDKNVPQAQAVIFEDRASISSSLERLIDELGKTGARSALSPARRLRDAAIDPQSNLTYGDVGHALKDIESRFVDHVDDIKLFVLTPLETIFMQSAGALLATEDRPLHGFSLAFPNGAFEIEEASKCFALGRHTAAVFHCMRAVESGIKALSAFMELSDPTKPAEKNWGIILKAVRTAIDTKWPVGQRTAGSVGAQIDSLYATLDAVRNPWRNATMHVETIYAQHEALHIMRCVGVFLLQLSRHCDEEGRPPNKAPAVVDQPQPAEVVGAGEPAR